MAARQPFTRGSKRISEQRKALLSASCFTKTGDDRHDGKTVTFGLQPVRDCALSWNVQGDMEKEGGDVLFVHHSLAVFCQHCALLQYEESLTKCLPAMVKDGLEDARVNFLSPK